MAKSETYCIPIDRIGETRFVKETVGLIQSGTAEINLKTLHGSAKAFAIAALRLNIDRPFFAILPDRQSAESFFNDLTMVLPGDEIALLSEPEQTLKIESDNESEPLIWLADALSKMQNAKNPVAVAVPEIFELLIPEPEAIISSRIKLKKGDRLDRDLFVGDLVSAGFERKDYVSLQGDIAVRGGIVDIFPAGRDNPVRIEFWDDEIEAIRTFDTLSQRSVSELDSIEFIGNIMGESSESARANILDYIDSRAIIVEIEPDEISRKTEEEFPVSGFQKLYVNKLTPPDVSVHCNPQPKLNASIRDFGELIAQRAARNDLVYLSAEGKVHLERFRDMLENSTELDEAFEKTQSGDKLSLIEAVKSIRWIESSPSAGWELPDDGLALYTEHEVFGRLHTRRERPVRSKAAGFTIKELKQLNIGDYVVHEDKGIARFEGFKSVELGGVVQDCVRLAFAGGDVLYVQINFIRKLQKYSSSEGTEPQLSKLGTSDWARKKARTKKKLKDIARDLIKLYAARKARTGFAFRSDTVWQKEFEASFIYEDTPDQAVTTVEVKRDMESRTPMDRLVCGDVGFGKTEIAIRAAFKAVQSGKQVAVLVPTTVLARQHYMSFKDRLEHYPVIVEALSRFKSKADQTKILERSEQGRVDILIGTHRLLSKDVKFKDLGLLIIDEEHRFGVGSKEKLREMRVDVDTLTLTATPIPRTLNFSLMGARDLSVIETPPRNRLPVYTEIMEWNNNAIIKAVSSEIERGGQVFFVTDKVNDIEKITRDLQMLLPTLKFGIAHGQMQPRELEKIMEKFTEKKLDVLVATKIIESGLDIPNANTMIINRAQNFGLAELYQLRGRVGRSNRKAYCYLLIPPVKTISQNTLRRLQAIEEFTDLGSGFKLAMRDMEIRGAGNLLGAEQSGFILDIGFDLFNKILDEAVTELREDEFSDLFKGTYPRKPRMFKNDDLTIDLDAEAFIPPDYVASDTDRFDFYKRMYNSTSFAELSAIIEDLEDKYGTRPKNVDSLIFAVKLRVAALDTGFTKVSLKHTNLTAEFPPAENKEFYEKALPIVTDYIQDDSRCILRQTKTALELRVQLGRRDEAVEYLWRLKKMMEAEFVE